MNTLTGNEDTDVVIINSLNLNDLRTICSSNQYANNLCKNHIILKSRFNRVKQKATHIMSLINDAYTGIILQPIYMTKFFSFNDIMNNIKMEEQTDNLQPPNFYNDWKVTLIYVFEADDDYYGVQYGLDDLDEMTFAMFYGNTNQMIEFLTQIYYNQLIILA